MESLLLKVRQRIRSLETSRHLEYWLQGVEVAEGTQGQLTLKCPDAFSVQWLSGRHGEALSSLFSQEAGRDVKLTFQVDPFFSPRTVSDETPEEICLSPSRALPAGLNALTGTPVGGEEPFPGWNPRFRFSTFVTGPSNAFASAAATEVAGKCSSEYNPFVIHAPTGLGKTHLAQAVAHRLFEGNRNLRILWRTAESFFAEMIRHIQDKDVTSFKTRYRDACDVLLLDDIQFLEGKKALQSELCHTLDILLNQGKQVVLLGNLPARGRKGLDENLDSRIFSGLAVTMKPPEFETRLAILKQFSESSGIPFPEETLAVVARCVRTHVRDLEGAFKRMMAMQAYARHPIDPKSADRLFNIPECDPAQPIDGKAIRDHVAKCFGLDPERLSSRSRKNNVLYPRQIGMYLTRKHTHQSLECIGQFYNRDHASVLNALRSLQKKMETSAKIAREVRFIEDKLLEGL